MSSTQAQRLIRQASGEYLLLLAVLGDRTLRLAIDRELDQRALGMPVRKTSGRHSRRVA